MMRRLLNSGAVRFPQLLSSHLTFRLPSLRAVFLGLAFVGFSFLCFVAGAAFLFFDVPPADYLRNAFLGGIAWGEQRWEELRTPPAQEEWTPGVPSVDIPEKTYDGFTLYTTTEGCRARLLDMGGNVVHTWRMPFREALQGSSFLASKHPEDRISWFRCHVYPNGDLLAVYHADNHTPYGIGLAKIDRDSRLLWSYTGNVHHGVTVAEDGTIYALTQRIASKVPAGMHHHAGPYIADFVVVLSPDGKPLDEFPILEALCHSSYAELLSKLERTMAADPFRGPELSPSTKLSVRLPSGFTGVSSEGDAPPSLTGLPDDTALAEAASKGDLIHTNSIRILTREMASRFPLFRAGQLLISARSLDLIAVLDPATHSVVWAALGPWHGQHDAEFLANGNLLIYDNLGSPGSTRILEYNPNTQAIPWTYANENAAPFTAMARGVKQRLANGNTLIADPYGARIFEVTPTKELVWECHVGSREATPAVRVCLRTAINDLKRLTPEQVPFVKAGPRSAQARMAE